MTKLNKTGEKDKTLEQVLLDIEKQFGKGAIMKLGEGGLKDIDVVSSGSLALDIALGVGGYPKGRIIEIYGPESSGKTTFALHAIAEVQKTGGKAAFIDAEHALDPVYAKKLGVNINDLLLSENIELYETGIRNKFLNIKDRPIIEEITLNYRNAIDSKDQKIRNYCSKFCSSFKRKLYKNFKLDP